MRRTAVSVLELTETTVAVEAEHTTDDLADVVVVDLSRLGFAGTDNLGRRSPTLGVSVPLVPVP